MIDHSSWCVIGSTGYCNCKPISGVMRTERWTYDEQTFTIQVNNLNETVVCSYQTLAVLLNKAGLVKAEDQ